MNPTISEITDALAKRGKPIARSGVYPHLAALKIKPVGARQRPQRYPTDTIPRLLNYLGLNQPFQYTHKDAGLLSIREIRQAAKRKGGRNGHRA